MVIALLFSSLFCNRPSQNEVRMLIKTLGLLLILLSSYNKLAAIGAVMFLIAISYPRDGRHKLKEKVSVTHTYYVLIHGPDRFRSIFPSMKLPSLLLMS